MAIREDSIAAPRVAASGDGAHADRYLFGPVVDFVCLGGGSLILLPIVLALPLAPYEATITQALIALAFFVNYPHFAHSYQIFYRNFAGKAFGRDYSPLLRARYLAAGVLVPAALVLFFVVSIARGDPRLLGLGVNLMLLLVGWHYVKQGYGILMVDAVLKRQYFGDVEKRLLRLNAYMVWLLAWLLGNSAISEHEMFTLHYYTFAAPAVALNVLGVAAGGTGILAAAVLLRRWRANGGSLPWNGVFAYVASLYFWILFLGWDIDPVWLVAIPAFHSLQYLAVVWRYQLGLERDRAGADKPLNWRLARTLNGRAYHVNMALFVALGMILGFLGFWAIPVLLQVTVTYDTELFGSGMFLFIFFIFINVHHYFLDNVMWRRENPDMRRYLFH